MYIFKHALMQDAAYASLVRSRWRHIHQQVAELLITRFPETVASQPEWIAHHYSAAGAHESAIAYWQRAGQQASARSAQAEAIRHFTQGMELLSFLSDTAKRQQLELQFQLGLVFCLCATTGYAASETGQAFNRARELSQHMGHTPELFPMLWGLWTYYIVRGELRTGQEFADQLFAASNSEATDSLLKTMT